MIYNTSMLPKYNLSKKPNGFTLVELLLVITLISILSGVLISTINFANQRKNAEDAIRRETIYKIVESLETYRLGERGLYPTDPNSDGNPSDDPMLATYFKNGWPNGTPNGATYSYWVSAARDTAGVTVIQNSGRVFKFRSEWGAVQNCTIPGRVSPADTVCTIYN